MRIVLDANVLVSGLIIEGSRPGKVFDLISQKRCQAVTTPKILEEYGEVLCRPKFHLSVEKIKVVLKIFHSQAHFIEDMPLYRSLPDPDDVFFLAAAYHSKADALVTGNSKDFPSHLCKPVTVVNPSRFLKHFI